MNWTSLGLDLVKLGAPVVASVFLGPEAGPLAGALVSKLAGAFGTDPTVPAVQAAMKADPDAASKVQAVEAQQADIVTAYLADVADARSMTVDLGKAGSPLAYAAVIVTTYILLGFTAICILILLGYAKESNLILAIYGTFSSFAGIAVAFWLGSTKQSADKTNALVSMAQTVTPAARRGR